MEPISAALWTLLAALFRSVAGWLEHAMADGKITKFELAKLGSTVFRVLVMGLGLYFPMESFGVDNAQLASAGAALVLDFLVRAMKIKPPE